MPVYDRLYSLLRLACKTGNGFVPERQNALEKAIAYAAKHAIDLQNTIYELKIEIDDLQHTFNKTARNATLPRFAHSRINRPRQTHSEDFIDGVYSIAGFQYYEGPRLRSLFRIGQAVTLQALTTNPHDAFAVAVFYGDLMIGYVPRRKNQKIWTWLRSGRELSARISAINSFEGYGAVEIYIKRLC